MGRHTRAGDAEFAGTRHTPPTKTPTFPHQQAEKSPLQQHVVSYNPASAATRHTPPTKTPTFPHQQAEKSPQNQHVLSFNPAVTAGGYWLGYQKPARALRPWPVNLSYMKRGHPGCPKGLPNVLTARVAHSRNVDNISCMIYDNQTPTYGHRAACTPSERLQARENPGT